jgi:hypothetical protein
LPLRATACDWLNLAAAPPTPPLSTPQAPNGLSPYVSPETGGPQLQAVAGDAAAAAPPHDLAAPPSPVLGGDDIVFEEEAAALALGPGAAGLGSASDEDMLNTGDAMDGLVGGHPVASLRADTPLRASTPAAAAAAAAARGRRGGAKAARPEAGKEPEEEPLGEEQEEEDGQRAGKKGKGKQAAAQKGMANGGKAKKAADKPVGWAGGLGIGLVGYTLQALVR